MAELLLVDDDQATLDWMTAALEGLGHEVRGARGGAAALEQLEDWRPDLIVSDIMMPEMDGLTFAKLVRRRVPVMFVSIARVQADAILAGAVGYVQKPATAGEVRRAVERVLGRDAADNTILVVEDDEDVREIYELFLAPRFSILEAQDGAAALEVLRAHPVDLVITDVHMPVMNGVELIRRMRAEPRFERLPVIVQTCDHTAVAAPVWRELSVAQVVDKTSFLQWLRQRVEARVEELPSARRRGAGDSSEWTSPR